MVKGRVFPFFVRGDKAFPPVLRNFFLYIAIHMPSKKLLKSTYSDPQKIAVDLYIYNLYIP